MRPEWSSSLHSLPQSNFIVDGEGGSKGGTGAGAEAGAGAYLRKMRAKSGGCVHVCGCVSVSEWGCHTLYSSEGFSIHRAERERCKAI